MILFNNLTQDSAAMEFTRAIRNVRYTRNGQMKSRMIADAFYFWYVVWVLELINF